MTNVIDLASIIFPVGSKAWHPKYRICRVIESQGNQRKIRVMEHGKVEFSFQYVTVHVNELQKMEGS